MRVNRLASSSLFRWVPSGSNPLRTYRDCVNSDGARASAERAQPMTMPHNLAVAGSNRDSTTCFLGSETGLPLGYMKGHRPRTVAFFVSTPSLETPCGMTGSSIVSLAPPRATFYPSGSPPATPVLAPKSRLPLSLSCVGLTGVASARSLRTCFD